MQSIRQGDVILQPVPQIDGQNIPHLSLASGEVTGHKHRITEGKAELYAQNNTFFYVLFQLRLDFLTRSIKLFLFPKVTGW